jgi:hypothetical protein
MTIFVFQGIGNVKTPIIATAGRVTARTTELIWNNWNLPVLEDVIGKLEIKPKGFDRVLYFSQGGGNDFALKIIHTQSFANLQLNASLCNGMGPGEYFIRKNYCSFVQNQIGR